MHALASVKPQEMNTQEIVQAILSKHPELTEKQILEAVEAEKHKIGGLIADDTLLRLIAIRHGVEVPKEPANECKLLISHLIPSLNNVTLSGRVVAIYPTKTFEGTKPGKYASLLIADREGLLRVMLWNGKADLVETGVVTVGQVVRFVRGYTREDRNGKTELHIGEKGEVEVNPEDLDKDAYPFIEHFILPIREIRAPQQTIHLIGRVKTVSPLSTFTRYDNSVGKVLRFTIVDETGDVVVVAWNEKAEKLEASLKNDAGIKLVNARIKLGSNSGFEVHVDEFTYVEVFDASK